ncbi:hypothetical protein PHYSODRAFT_322258 [Phytophthora sojae]|uniref:Uncharacterized protein n=1 Tax=Phytophthora sojae (strain P6497) TaxID=1094619 RepID=G4YMI4_PHYSP|nr:hypothetical protein PHYSODRAFT_322258 [Phytophthora sojae]EGZ28610.1 hypothetical protein PHYSODRAFT_322258 [Phytophthora sojae]|eukprot:XP_009515885.1 hypothetical protein PHYSODRAFT_322258 [Phytophthora sojae]
MSTRVTQAELRTLERAFKVNDLRFDCNVTWVSLSAVYSIIRISDNRVTLASVLDEFFGGIYRTHGTDVKRVSDERFAEYEGRPFSVCFADLLEVVCENEDTRAAYNTQVSNVTWEPQSAKPRRDAFVRLHMCYTNKCGRRPQYALEKIWAHVLQCDLAVKSAIEVYKPGMSDPLEVVYLTPVDDDDPIIYPPPERSQGLFSDDYDWIPDGICEMYLIDGGTTGNYLLYEPGMFCVEKLGMSDEFRLHDRIDKAFVEAAEKEFRQRMGKLNLGWIYSDATDHDKKELIRQKKKAMADLARSPIDGHHAGRGARIPSAVTCSCELLDSAEHVKARPLSTALLLQCEWARGRGTAASAPPSSLLPNFCRRHIMRLTSSL